MQDRLTSAYIKWQSPFGKSHEDWFLKEVFVQLPPKENVLQGQQATRMIQLQCSPKMLKWEGSHVRSIYTHEKQSPWRAWRVSSHLKKFKGCQMVPLRDDFCALFGIAVLHCQLFWWYRTFLGCGEIFFGGSCYFRGGWCNFLSGPDLLQNCLR